MSETPSLRQFAIAALFVLVAGTAPATIALAPKSAGLVAVVVPPWTARGEAARIVAAVNGTIVGATRGGNVAIALSGDADFVTRLYQSGALLVVDAAAIATCLTIERNHPSPATRIPI